MEYDDFASSFGEAHPSIFDNPADDPFTQSRPSAWTTTTYPPPLESEVHPLALNNPADTPSLEEDDRGRLFSDHAHWSPTLDPMDYGGPECYPGRNSDSTISHSSHSSSDGLDPVDDGGPYDSLSPIGARDSLSPIGARDSLSPFGSRPDRSWQASTPNFRSPSTSTWIQSTPVTNPLPYRFGVEIEFVGQPHTIFKSGAEGWMNTDDVYWRKRLKDELIYYHIPAVEGGRKYVQYYDQWYITKDASLAVESHYQVAIEAVSPIIESVRGMDKNIELFWFATRNIFEIKSNVSCGTHIHVSPTGRRYTFAELRKIAYAVASQEELIMAILPPERVDNHYCRPSSSVSVNLRDDITPTSFDGPDRPTLRVTTRLWDCNTEEQLVTYMQAGNRMVLWNFENVLKECGTVEFRGGRHMRGPKRTKRWIAFAVVFVAKAIGDTWAESSRETDIDDWWRSIWINAADLGLEEYLPKSWSRMRDVAL